MSDKITVTSRNSYWSRVKNSFWKIWLGIFLVILSIIFLFKNEQSFVETKAALNEWAEIVQETISTEINPQLDNAEVHLYGETSSPAESLQDSTFGIITNDLKLNRNVSMYQWTEEESEKCTDNIWWSETCETTYSYTKIWADYPIHSDDFYQTQWHENPTNWKYESQEREKSPILVWVYTLSSTFTNKLQNYKTLDLSTQNIIVPEEYKTSDNSSNSAQENTIEDNNNSYLYGDDTQAQENTQKNETNYQKFHIYNDHIYIGRNESEPELWDLKITFSSVKTGTVSIIWQQVWDTLTSYATSNWKSIALLQEWQVSAESMFASAQSANKFKTKLFRILLLVLMFIWFSMIFEFITTLAKVLPFLSRIVWAWTGIVAFSLTLIFGFLTIWISRLAVRPIVWVSCLAIVVVWIILLIKTKKNKKAKSWNDSNPKNDKDLEIIEA